MVFNEKESKQWSRMGPRAMFGQFMLDIAEKNNDLMVLSAGLRRSSGLERFKSKHPDKYLDIGISEQNLIGVAAGLARDGYKVFVTSFAPFLSMRASEQARPLASGRSIEMTYYFSSCSVVYDEVPQITSMYYK